MNYKFNFVKSKDFVTKENIDYLNKLPDFPNNNSIQIIDGTSVVKLSDTKLEDTKK